ncbi:GNAT family protein [Streptomyces sp. NPDC048411]|uniref:GNAT family N-acetyltransferase n=1 Tax=Streptomyces sp. NPDC048411 TaxID=3157206 RepID=UPI003455086A
MHPVNITGPRLQLRELHSRDVDALHAIQGDADVTRHMKLEPRTREEVEHAISCSITSAGAEPRNIYMLAVVCSEERQLIGYADLDLDPFAEKAATIGFMLRPDIWGRGLGTEVVHLLCALGFHHLGLHRIWATRSPLNAASGKTLLKAGMTEDGRIRDHVFVDGAWRDSITYSVLNHEWQAPEGICVSTCS